MTPLSSLDYIWDSWPTENQRGSPSGYHRERALSEFGTGPTGCASPQTCQRAVPRSSTVPAPRWGPAAHSSNQQVRPGHTRLWCEEMYSKGIQRNVIMLLWTHNGCQILRLQYTVVVKSLYANIYVMAVLSSSDFYHSHFSVMEWVENIHTKKHWWTLVQ